MSRSDPPSSKSAGSPPAASPRAEGPARARRRRPGVRFAALARWLHIYLSMFSLAAVLFFSVTGLTLNHPDWFFGGTQSIVQARGRIDPAWLASAEADDADDPERQVDRLEVVEHLRATHGIGGALAEFRVDDYECLVTFKGPGYAADAFVDRETGDYQLTETYQGALAVFNDLHKGRDTGTAWSVVIDLSAVLLTVISLTGLVLLLYLKLRRAPGLAVALGGTVVVVLVVLLLVP